jgi:hypothetical protein
MEIETKAGLFSVSLISGLLSSAGSYQGKKTIFTFEHKVGNICLQISVL